MSARVYLVNALSRSDRALIADLYLDSKVIRTPAYAPKAKTKMDLDILCDSRELEHTPAALVLNVDEAATILAERQFAQGQLTLDGTAAESDLGRLTPAPILLDPSMEMFYFRTGRSPAVRNLYDLPPSLREITRSMTTKNHNASWNRIRQQRLELSFVDAYVSYAAGLGPDVIPSPVPVLNGKNRDILQLASEVIQWTASIVGEKTTAFPAVMLPLHYSAFSKPAFMQEILAMLRLVMPSQRLLILKILYYSNLHTSQLLRRRVGEFLSEIDDLKHTLEESFVTMLMDARSEGLITLANGVDIYSEPLDLHIHPFRRAGREEEAEPDPYGRYGKYIHPDDRQDWSFADLLEEIGRSDGLLPHDCRACHSLHGRLIPGAMPQSLEWNRGRRQHAFNLRNEEIGQLQAAIENGSVRDIAMRVARGGDLNFFDLLPSEYRP